MKPLIETQHNLETQLKFEVISFETLGEFWRETKHFAGTDSKGKPYVNRLGPYQSDFEQPPFMAFAIRFNKEVIAATQFVNWSEGWVRYRTIHVKEPFRGNGLGFRLLCYGHKRSWPEKDVFGWVRQSHLGWSLHHGFRPLSNQWHGSHIAMLKPAHEFQTET
jgi:hypothetical protein